MKGRKERRKEAILLVAIKHTPFELSDEYLARLPVAVQVALHEHYIQQRNRDKSTFKPLESKRQDLLQYIEKCCWNEGNKKQVFQQIKNHLIRYYQK